MKALNLIEPSEPRTSPSQAWYLVIGGEFAGRYRENDWPHLPCGPSAATFPVTVLCRNEAEYQDFQLLARFIEATIRGWDLYAVENIITLLERLKSRPSVGSLLMGKRECHAVLSEGREVICFGWPDAYHWVTTDTKWKFKKFGNFWGALEYTLRRGLRARDPGVIDDLQVLEEEMNQLRLKATEGLITAPSKPAPVKPSVKPEPTPPASRAMPIPRPSTPPAELPAGPVVKAQKTRSTPARQTPPSTPTRRKTPSRAHNEPIEIRGSSEEDVPARKPSARVAARKAPAALESRNKETDELSDLSDAPATRHPVVYMNIRDAYTCIIGFITLLSATHCPETTTTH